MVSVAVLTLPSVMVTPPWTTPTAPVAPVPSTLETAASCLTVTLLVDDPPVTETAP